MDQPEIDSDDREPFDAQRGDDAGILSEDERLHVPWVNPLRSQSRDGKEKKSRKAARLHCQRDQHRDKPAEELRGADLEADDEGGNRCATETQYAVRALFERFVRCGRPALQYSYQPPVGSEN